VLDVSGDWDRVEQHSTPSFFWGKEHGEAQTFLLSNLVAGAARFQRFDV
jgi:hypothetical protein